MTEKKPSDSRFDGSRTPSLREQLKPVELIGIAAVLSIFVGLVVLLGSREPLLAVIFFGVAFIVALVVLAMFVLGAKPDPAERQDLAEQNRDAAGAPGSTAPGSEVPDSEVPGEASGGQASNPNHDEPNRRSNPHD